MAVRGWLAVLARPLAALDRLTSHGSDELAHLDREGRGLAREAVSALIAVLFDQLQLERVEAVTDTRNAAAKGLLAGLGFRFQSVTSVTFKGVECREETYVLSRRDE